MCYRCATCNQVVPAGQPRLVHPIHRIVKLPKPRREIAVELAVCSACHHLLSIVGLTVLEVQQRRGDVAVPVPPTVANIAGLMFAQPLEVASIANREQLVNRWRTKRGSV